MLAVGAVEPNEAGSWASMRHALWPDAALPELHAEVLAFFKGASVFITAAFLAREDEEPVGFIELNLRAYAEGCESSPVPHVEGWYVVPRARRRGVGRRLMGAAHAANGFEEVERLIALRKKLIPSRA